MAVQEKLCECDKRQPGSPFTDGRTVCVNCSGIIWRGLPDFDTAVEPGFGGFRLVETPLAYERRAFWREAFHSVDLDRTRESEEVTKMCAKFADAALKEFDERFGK